MSILKQPFVLLLIIFASVCGCKNDDEGDPMPVPTTSDTTCRIVRIDQWSGFHGSSDTAHTVVTYDAKRRIARVTLDSQVTALFTYDDNKIYIERPHERDTVILDSEGLVLQTRKYPWNEFGTITTVRTDFLYSGKEVQRAIRTVVGTSRVVDTTYYYWSNGNCNTATYRYSDKLVPASGGDLLALREWLRYGAVVVRNKNLVSGVGLSSVSYQFDERGKVVQILDQFVSINGYSRYYRLSYECP